MSTTYTFARIWPALAASDRPATGQAATDVFRVETTGAQVYPIDVVNWALSQRTAGVSGRIPCKGDSYGALYVQSVEVATSPSAFSDFTYTVQYAGYPTNADPTQNAPVIEWGGTDQVEDMFQDVAGAPVVNALGEYFAQQPQRERGYCTCTITGNETANPAANIKTYSWSINTAALFGSAVAARFCRIGRITARKRYQGYQTYWEVTYPLSFKTDGLDWRARPLEVAYHYRLTAGDPAPKWASDRDADGNAVQVFLNADGTKNTSGTPVVANGGNGFQKYNEIDQGALSLPNPFA